MHRSLFADLNPTSLHKNPFSQIPSTCLAFLHAIWGSEVWYPCPQKLNLRLQDRWIRSVYFSGIISVPTNLSPSLDTISIWKPMESAIFHNVFYGVPDKFLQDRRKRSPSLCTSLPTMFCLQKPVENPPRWHGQPALKTSTPTTISDVFNSSICRWKADESGH